VRYWEEFGTIAFDPAHDTLLTACSLKNPYDETKRIVNCCFSFRIRRDDHKVHVLSSLTAPVCLLTCRLQSEFNHRKLSSSRPGDRTALVYHGHPAFACLGYAQFPTHPLCIHIFQARRRSGLALPTGLSYES
jgi:hypothetical protein